MKPALPPPTRSQPRRMVSLERRNFRKSRFEDKPILLAAATRLVTKRSGRVCVEFLDDLDAGSAYKVGIKIGDIIIAVDHVEVNNFPEITSVLLKHRP